MKNPISSQVWDAKTDEQKIEWLAKEVMGWKKFHWEATGDYSDWQKDGRFVCTCDSWNPLEDHNDFHELEKKVMEDEKLFGKYKRSFMTTDHIHPYILNDNIYLYLKSDLPTKCKALYLAKKCSQSYSEQISKGSIDEDYFAHGPDITPIELAKMTGARKQVFDIMIDGEWRHLQQIQDKMFDFAPEQSIGIYLRSFREPKYGGYKVEKRKLSPARVFEYRVSSPIL